MIPASCALVGFVHTTDLWWLRLLRPGFRHCFVAVRSGPFWVVIDPLSHHTTIRVETIAGLAGFYRRHGITVVTTRLRPPPRRAAPWRPYTCVEAVKRILGIQAGGVITPWQLYRLLTSKENIP
ncbi:hypothetical protein [Magnetospirillum sulfuroxidans]|uniref:Uncharacterized protein n=1 Tax=Magnetospirillum sulfuroxidans TaxID=611300 RepID=A0ABS5IBY3_9PROT|nr:hypothetical protein [Magnetospirillum sulfuroxidans]MBR9971791.1 hypothetical protein [Magnetospirillum sulfuroxidans]